MQDLPFLKTKQNNFIFFSSLPAFLHSEDVVYSYLIPLLLKTETGGQPSRMCRSQIWEKYQRTRNRHAH